jgi:hypothetical protein
MKLQEIFSRDISRTINAAVVASNQRAETVQAEIQEYVFTPELIEKLHLILDTVVNKRLGKTGIWINGYYGSGKSHFIKYVHYCLQPETMDDAFEHLQSAVAAYDGTRPGAKMDITPSNIALLKKTIRQGGVENILFNVEDESDDGSGERLTRIFLNVFNRFRGYNAKDIALALLLEKYLDEKGQYAAFKTLVGEELGYDWAQDAAEVAAFELERVLELAKRLVPELDAVALHAKLSDPDAFRISIVGTLIPELQKYLAARGPHYRLVFLADEVSQYIGANKEILLNFQNIIERVSEDCNNQVWIACTAQQTLDEVSLSTGSAGRLEDEFGKILGRFDTRISLQSNDAAYITQKRVLDKNSTGEEYLGKLYRDKQDYILNQFKIAHELYKGYQKLDEFTLAYPFVPYQFKLIAHVFEAFQQLQYVIKEVKDNERSVLAITHYTIKEHAHEEAGGFIPFDAFYNGMFRSNLTHRGAKAIENGLELDFVKTDPFAQRVVKALFMISNLLESQRQTFPSNLDNLTVLLMRELDQNRMKLQNQIRAVLERLREESIIREENGSYFFFNEDEIDVQNLIKSQALNLDERLERFDEIFRGIAGIRPKWAFGQNDFRGGYQLDGKEFLRRGDFDIIVLLFDVGTAEQKALDLKKDELGVCLNEWFQQDEALRKDFEWYCKTLKFFSNHGDAATGVRAKTIENFRVRNHELHKSIEARLRQGYAETRFISQQRVVSPDQLNGGTAEARTRSIIEKHLAGIYSKHSLAQGYAQTQLDLKRSAAADLQGSLHGMSPAEEAVNNIITQHNDLMTVHDLVQALEKPPFGWRAEAALDVLVHLAKKKKREFRYRNQPRYPMVDFINKAVSAAERLVCEVCSGEEIDQATLDEAAFAFRDIFNRDLLNTTDANELYGELLRILQQEQALYQPLEEDYHGAYPFGASFHEAVKLLSGWAGTRDPKALFDNLRAKKDAAKALLDTAKGLKGFVEQHRKDYDAVRQFYRDNTENFRELDIAAQEKAEKIAAFLQSPDPRSDYRHVRKAYEEVKAALKAYRQQLLEQALARYAQVFDELEAEKARLGVTESQIYADRERTLEGLRRLESIAQLKNKLLAAHEFRSEQLDILIRHAAAQPVNPARPGSPVGEPQVYYITELTVTISNEQELEAYLARARQEMLELLRQQKTIIIK